MKKVLLFLAVAALTMTACQQQTQTDKIYTIDEVYAQADSLVGDTISFEGICTHLCKHGGRKAFLMGSSEDYILRVEGAKAGNYALECINNIIRVRGVINAIEIIPNDCKTEIANDEQRHGEGANGCETEKKAIKRYFAEAINYEIITE